MTAHYRRPVKAPRREIASKFDFQEFGSKGQSRLVGIQRVTLWRSDFGISNDSDTFDPEPQSGMEPREVSHGAE